VSEGVILGDRTRWLGRLSLRVLFLRNGGRLLGNGLLHTTKLLDDRVLLGLGDDGGWLWLTA
jgi:hypothetical protein